MSFFTENYQFFLLGAVIFSLILFRMVRKGTMVYAEALRNVFSLFLGLSAIFLFYDRTTVVSGDFFSHFYVAALLVLLFPAAYLILKFILSPLYFALSRGRTTEKFEFLYVRLGRVERSILQYIAMLAIMISLLSFIEVFDSFQAKKLIAALLMFLSGVVLFIVRNTLHSEILTNVAMTNMAHGDLKESNRLLQESLLYRKDLPKTWAALVEVHRKQGDYKRAEKYLAFLKRIRPSSRITNTLEAELEYSRGKYARCVKVCRRILKNDPNFPEILILGTKASMALTEHAQTLEFFKPYLAGGGNDPEVFTMGLEAFFKKKNYSGVIMTFEKLECCGKNGEEIKISEDAVKYYKAAVIQKRKKSAGKVD